MSALDARLGCTGAATSARLARAIDALANEEDLLVEVATATHLLWRDPDAASPFDTAWSRAVADLETAPTGDARGFVDFAVASGA